MPYAEFHFSSAMTGRVKHSGTRNRRLVELEHPLCVSKFHVKDLELPLTWCNVRGLNGTSSAGLFSFQLTYAGGEIFRFAGSVAAGCMNLGEFTQALQYAFQNAVLLSPLVPVNPPPDLALITVVNDPNDGRMLFSFPAHAIGWPDMVLAPHRPLIGVQITWGTALAKYFSRSYLDRQTVANNTIVGIESAEFPGDYVATTLYPTRLVPNFVYLHSNLMHHTPYVSSSRAEGPHHSRTIVTKIQVDTSKTWGSQIQDWKNPHLSEHFMFELGNKEISQLEFWFTDDEGYELDFQNVEFSLTLAMFYVPTFY